MSYQHLAYIYDLLMEHAPYDKWYYFTEKVFEKFHKNVSTIADLGCGTGEVTLKLADAGYQLYGVDFSADMLTKASQKAVKQRVDIQWIQQDITRLTGISNLDAAISYCDVINYIPSVEGLKQTFLNVYHMLNHEGIFIFDVHAFNYAMNDLIGHTFADVTEDYSYIWFCEPGEEKGDMHHDLTFYIRNGSYYERFDEYHFQKVYKAEFYKHLLQKVGFSKIHIYADFSFKLAKHIESPERIFFIAEK
ncbi:MAG TPA: class I SAM-dependent methyltransferase [Bacillota bacterium]|nr:class I SAM-dependent methyltransferase [Bacillota bacterium]